MLRRATASWRTVGICTVLAALALALGPAAGVAAATQRSAVPNPGGSYPDDLTLALRLRPRLLFDSKERWRPTDVDRFLAEPGHQACPPPGGVCTPLTSLAQLTPSVAYLDLRGTRHDGSDATSPDIATCPKSLPLLRECDLGGRSVIYAHVTRRPAHGRPTRVAIDYWWFLRYNAYSIDQHEGDWEGVTVIADPFGARVLAVDFAAHSSVWRYDADVPKLVGNRVEVFVSRGDHAAYPRPCARLCRQSDATLPESHFDGKRSWVGNAAAGCHRRCVRLMPSGVDGAPSSWNGWDGRWGVPFQPGFAPPRTPAFQPRFTHPFAATHSGRHVFGLI